MSILQGTPISTQGIHPLVAIMAQGGDILSKGYQGASQQQARNTSMTMSFLQDAAQERISRQQAELEERKMMLNAQQHQADMEQRERMQATDIASRERMAAMRSSGGGGRGSSGGADEARQAAADAQRAQVAQMIGGIFQQAGGPQQPQPQQAAGPSGPIQGPTLPPGYGSPQGAGAGPNLPIEAYEKVGAVSNQAATAAYQGANKNLSIPENLDEVDNAYEIGRAHV